LFEGNIISLVEGEVRQAASLSETSNNKLVDKTGASSAIKAFVVRYDELNATGERNTTHKHMHPIYIDFFSIHKWH
jgi:hypothetical protein